MAKATHAAIATLHRKAIPAISHLKGLRIHDAGICLKEKMREAWQGRIHLGALRHLLNLRTAGATLKDGARRMSSAGNILDRKTATAW
jgi:hypothetical protein